MTFFSARVMEARILFGEQVFLLACPKDAVPSPGQYTLAVDEHSVLGIPLFNAGGWEDGFIAIPSRLRNWAPGSKLLLYGPQGQGFMVPEKGSHLVLITLGGSFCCLWPLASAWLKAGRLATLFSDTAFSDLPPALEVSPLTDLKDTLGWADFIAAVLPADRVGDLLGLIGDPGGGFQVLQGQVLVLIAMPCARLAECGICAVPLRLPKRGGRTIRTQRTWKLACTDGPVFELRAVLAGAERRIA